MTNPYLVRRRADYDALRQTIEGIQARASQENRDLTDDELTSVRSQGEQASTLAAEITDLTEIQNRHAAVASVGATVESASTEDTRPGATHVGSAATRDRDPGHYRSGGGGHSFFGDMFASRSLHDETATQRLVEHNRALDMPSKGAGVVPPGVDGPGVSDPRPAVAPRRAANAVRNIPLSSAAPISMPKETAGVDAAITD